MFHSGDIAVDPDTYDPEVFFEFMDAHSLHVVSPLVPGSIWQTMSTPGMEPPDPPRSDVMYGRRMNFIEACKEMGVGCKEADLVRLSPLAPCADRSAHGVRRHWVSLPVGVG